MFHIRIGADGPLTLTMIIEAPGVRSDSEELPASLVLELTHHIVERHEEGGIGSERARHKLVANAVHC